MATTQDQRQFSVSTPLEQDVLLFYRMSAIEELGRLFKYEVELLSEDANINLDDVLGKVISVNVELADNKRRSFHGYVSRIQYLGMQDEFHLYHATLRPWLWFLTRSADCRIFQTKTVPDIIKEVFRDFGFSEFEDQLSANYKQREYCAQYRETAFAFISRLMQQEGIYYYFKHDDQQHSLVLADSISAHSRVPENEQIPFYPKQEHERREADHLDDWYVSRDYESQRYTLNDFDFTKPKASLEVRENVEDGRDDYEIFDYPGEYSELEDGQAVARTRAEQLQSQFERVHGKGNVRTLCVGDLFELTNYPRDDQNKEYLITHARYFLHSDAYTSKTTSKSSPPYRCVITAIDSSHSYRSPRTTPRPKVPGPQTAIVVGPKGEQVWTDKYGRVKVQFHWDRYGKKDENSSCWVRVSQNWAGKRWGGMHIPHIGQEVIVDFLEGDPDRPLITGRVYNADNMPPKVLPGEKSKSIIRDDYGNELMFDATQGNEYIRLYSPHHNSGIELGKSYNAWTTSDDNSMKVGNSFEFGVGTKTEVYAGIASEAKLGLLSEFVAGTSIEYKVGGELSWNWTWEEKFTEGVITQYTNKDILSLSGEDHVLGAGDQLCLVGGSTGKKSSRSIVNLYPKSLTLTAGEAKVKHSHSGKVYSDQLFPEVVPQKSWTYVKLAASVATSVIASIPAIAFHPFVSEEEEGKPYSPDWTHITSLVLGVLTGLVASGYSGYRLAKEVGEDRRKRIEPVEHDEPAAKIELKDDGNINVQSDAGMIMLDANYKVDASPRVIAYTAAGQTGAAKLVTENASVTAQEDGLIDISSSGAGKNIVLDPGFDKVDIAGSTFTKGADGVVIAKNLKVLP
ncbi:type VI secretion system Vgr family protein [Kaarinaea lacus]